MISLLSHEGFLLPLCIPLSKESSNLDLGGSDALVLTNSLGTPHNSEVYHVVQLEAISMEQCALE